MMPPYKAVGSEDKNEAVAVFAATGDLPDEKPWLEISKQKNRKITRLLVSIEVTFGVLNPLQSDLQLL